MSQIVKIIPRGWASVIFVTFLSRTITFKARTMHALRTRVAKTQKALFLQFFGTPYPKCSHNLNRRTKCKLQTAWMKTEGKKKKNSKFSEVYGCYRWVIWDRNMSYQFDPALHELFIIICYPDNTIYKTTLSAIIWSHSCVFSPNTRKDILSIFFIRTRKGNMGSTAVGVLENCQITSCGACKQTKIHGQW